MFHGQSGICARRDYLSVSGTAEAIEEKLEKQEPQNIFFAGACPGLLLPLQLNMV